MKYDYTTESFSTSTDATTQHDVEDEFSRFLERMSEDGWEFISQATLAVPSVRVGTAYKQYFDYSDKTFFIFRRPCE